LRRSFWRASARPSNQHIEQMRVAHSSCTELAQTPAWHANLRCLSHVSHTPPIVHGLKHLPDSVSELMGFRGGGVLVVIEGFDGITLRTMYTVRSEDAEYVLHAFQKKSTQATVEGAMQGSL